MPKRYESIRDKLIREGVSRKQAEKQAARIHNSQKKPSEPAAGKHRRKGGGGRKK